MAGEYGAAVKEIFEACGKDPQLYALLLGNLKPRITSHRVYLNCPQCNQRSGWLIPGSKTIRCNHENNCGKETPVLSAFYNRTDLLSGEDFKLAVREASKLTAVNISESVVSRDVTTGRGSERAVQSNTLLSLWRITNEAVATGRGRDYLIGRGFHPDFLCDNFGFLESAHKLKSVLPERELRNLGLLGPADGSDPECWSNRIIIPSYDSNGKLIGLCGRSLDDRDDKYRNTTGYRVTENIYNLHNAKRYDSLILVEGRMDVLKARQYGIQNVVGADGCHFGARIPLLSQMVGKGISLTVLLDADAAGQKGVKELLEAFDNSDVLAELRIATNTSAKDLSDVGSADEATRIINASQPAHRFRAQQLWQDLGPSPDIPRFVDEAIRYAESITSPRLKLRIEQHFLPEVRRLSGLSRVQIEAVREEYAAKKEEIAERNSLLAKLNNVVELATAGSIEEAKQLAGSAFLSPSVRQCPKGDDALRELQGYFIKIAERPMVGLPSSFQTLDNNMGGIHKLTLLAGDTNIGKTVMLGQMAMKAVKEGHAVLFLSFEMLRREIYARMWCQFANLNFHDLKDIYKEGKESYYEGMLRDSGLLDRVRIIHPRTDRWFKFSPQAVLEQRAILQEETGCERVETILDYFQSLPNPPGMNNLDAEMAHVDTLLEIKDGMPEDDPLLVVSAVRKRDTKYGDGLLTLADVMGTSKLPYSCDNILIWNRFSNQMLYEHGIVDGPYIGVQNEPVDSQWDKIKGSPETKHKLRTLRNRLEEIGYNYGQIEICKGRDGTRKTSFNVTMKYLANTIVEGLEM